MRVAVVGAGISGLVSAYVLAEAGVEVVLYEKEDYLGGHAKTVSFDGVDLDLGFMVFNRVTYPNMMEFFESLGIDMELSDMSFSVSLDEGQGCEWGSRNGLSGLFAQKKNMLNPYFWKMLREIIKFKDDVLSYLEMLENNPDVDRNETLGKFVKSRGCAVLCRDGLLEMYSGCIMAVHAPDALALLGTQATFDETRILGAFQYIYSDIFLHRDKKFMPQNSAAWSAWNFLGSTDNKVCLTYWLNVLQNIDETGLPFLVTLNPDHAPDHTLVKWSTGHPVPSVAATKASLELDHIQGKRRIWFCGAYQGYGFHEDGLKSAMVAANGLLGNSCAILSNPKHMAPSILLEEGGTVFSFEGTSKKCSLKTVLKVHNPQFYWKILIVNRDVNKSASKLNKKRGWWTPLLFTAGIASAKFFIQHVSRQNTLTQARRNISRHYDLV
ncbi:hypothetical protein NC651_021008 [Populus alba x Populus x berolinensis]|nr:hypothetical protein NC651_021008 [Populus alba x Populus x berolinensis]